MDEGGMNKISISVCTRRRPEMLRACLKSILTQIKSSARDDMLIVVENDLEPLSRQIINELAEDFAGITIIYHHEPNLGIPIARNKCIDLAFQNKADWLAFIDDDEMLGDGWLTSMHRAIEEFDAEAIVGPVVALWPDKLPAWFNVPKTETRPRGHRLKTAATNNTLISLAWLQPRREQLRFDEKMRFTGGEDSDFFFRLTDMGGRIMWVDDARVYEHIEGDRLTAVWNIKRAHRTAASNFYISSKRRGYIYAFSRILPKILGRFARGIAQLAFGAGLFPLRHPGSQSWMFEGAKALASAVGSMQGVVGIQPNPYRRVIGR